MELKCEKRGNMCSYCNWTIVLLIFMPKIRMILKNNFRSKKKKKTKKSDIFRNINATDQITVHNLKNIYPTKITKKQVDTNKVF